MEKKSIGFLTEKYPEIIFHIPNRYLYVKNFMNLKYKKCPIDC